MIRYAHLFSDHFVMFETDFSNGLLSILCQIEVIDNIYEE